MDDLRAMTRRDLCALVRPVDAIVYVIGWAAIACLLLMVAFGAMGVL